MNEITSYNNINFKFEDETLWITADKIAQIFSCTTDNIYLHIKNIIASGELTEESSVKGKRDKLYSLDIIIAVGYRVNSAKATHFRIWATNILKQYIKDGYVIDEKRLTKDPEKLNKIAAKIRELRNNEKNIYEAVRQCFKISAKDYDKDSKECRQFYYLLQDKFHYAITEMTASELILDRADHTQDNLGLQSMEGSIPTLEDIKNGKNFVQRDELYRMHLLSEQFLLHAESVALRNKRYTMNELHSKLDELLKLNEYPIFEGYKTYLKDEAIEHAKREYKNYIKIQKLKYSGIDVDLEEFHSGGYDQLYEELELEHKNLSTLLKKNNKKIGIEKKESISTQIIESIKKDYPNINNNNFEKKLEKISMPKSK
jgi:hypothetical protein